MARNEHTRRRVLRMGGQAAAVGALASSAGCISSIPFIGGWSYQNWMHAPGEINDDRDHYGFNLTQPKAIIGKEDNLEDNYVEQYEDTGTIGELTGLDGEDVTHTLNWGGFLAVKANYNKSDVTDELEDNDFEEDSDYSGYTVYVNETEDSNYYGLGFAIKGGKFIATFAGDPDTTVDHLESAIDTRKGETTRYVEDSDAMKVLTNKLGVKHDMSGRTFEEIDESRPEAGQFPGQVASGSATQINGSTSKLRQVFVFEDNDAASDADVDDWVDAREDGSGIWSEADSSNTNVSGKAVVVKGKVDSDELGQQ